MQLTIKERMALIGILRGQEGRLVIVKALRKAREALELDEQDYADAQVCQEHGCPKCQYVDYFPVVKGTPTCPLCKAPMAVGERIKWNADAPAREIALGDVAQGVIVGHFKTLESDGKLTDDLLDLYEKFIPDA